MNRYAPLLLGLSTVLTTGARPAPAAPERPNIIYILVDDMGYADLGVTGQTNFATPRIDRMAEQGILFTDSYCGSTVCAPSRACLLSGQHTGHTWQRGNLGPIQFREDPLDPTVATLLRGAGYRTAMIGKSGLSCNSQDGGLPNRKGFEHFYGLVSHQAAHRHYPTSLWRNGERVELPGNEGYTGDHYISELFVAEAERWMAEAKDGPFFLHLALTPPHADIVVPEKYRAPYMGKFKEKPNQGGYYKQQHPKATYAGMLNFIDQSVGRVLDTLEKHGMAENTAVFFASDNGPSWEGGKVPEDFDSNGIYRGGKRDLYEGGIRTPLIVRWPGAINPGRTSDLPNAMWDFLPTACDLAGIDVPEWTDGISILPTLLGREKSQMKHDYLYWEFYERGGKQAVRMGRWKGVRVGLRKDPDASLELYDLEKDPGEQHDLAPDHPDVVKRIRAAMEEAHTPSEIFSFAGGADASKLPLPDPILLPEAETLEKSGWRIVDVSSESSHNGKTGDRAIDGDLRNWWHSHWRDRTPGHPHRLTIDLGSSQAIGGLRYLPRQDGETNGRVNAFAIYVSEDAHQVGCPIVMGQFANNRKQQEIRFKQPATGRYIRFVIASGFADDPHASVAELDLLAVPADAERGGLR